METTFYKALDHFPQIPIPLLPSIAEVKHLEPSKLKYSPDFEIYETNTLTRLNDWIENFLGLRQFFFTDYYVQLQLVNGSTPIQTRSKGNCNRTFSFEYVINQGGDNNYIETYNSNNEVTDKINIPVNTWYKLDYAHSEKYKLPTVENRLSINIWKYQAVPHNVFRNVNYKKNYWNSKDLTIINKS
jgi:hypothetical protein